MLVARADVVKCLTKLFGLRSRSPFVSTPSAAVEDGQKNLTTTLKEIGECEVGWYKPMVDSPQSVKLLILGYTYKGP